MSPAKDNLESLIVTLLERQNRNLETSIELFKSTSNQVAINSRLVMEFIQDLKKYREEREKKETESTDGNTTQRVEQRVESALKSRLAFFYWFLDRAAPGIVIAIILAILKKLGFL